jgi:hypothetical protein
MINISHYQYTLAVCRSSQTETYLVKSANIQQVCTSPIQVERYGALYEPYRTTWTVTTGRLGPVRLVTDTDAYLIYNTRKFIVFHILNPQGLHGIAFLHYSIYELQLLSSCFVSIIKNLCPSCLNTTLYDNLDIT